MFSRTKENIKNDIFILRERVAHVEKELDQIQTNGVATAINKLNQEVFQRTKPTDNMVSVMYGRLMGEKPPIEATLSAKVDAILEYLGLEINVEPEKVGTKKTKKGRK